MGGDRNGSLKGVTGYVFQKLVTFAWGYKLPCALRGVKTCQTLVVGWVSGRVFVSESAEWKQILTWVWGPVCSRGHERNPAWTSPEA